jgi:hypothetical protein
MVPPAQPTRQRVLQDRAKKVFRLPCPAYFVTSMPHKPPVCTDARRLLHTAEGVSSHRW